LIFFQSKNYFEKQPLFHRTDPNSLIGGPPDKNSTSKDPHLEAQFGPLDRSNFIICLYAHSLTHSAIAPNYIILLKTNEKRNPNIKPIKKEKKTFIAQNNFYPILTHHPPIAHFMYGRNWNKLNRPACSCLYLSYLFFFFFFF
jgi:hypothetical protein